MLLDCIMTDTGDLLVVGDVALVGGLLWVRDGLLSGNGLGCSRGRSLG